jgi:CRP-like cAMP-binding protein
MNLQCENCLDSANSIFQSLTQEQKLRLQKSYVCKQIRKGEIIFREGEHPKGLISLSKGKVKVFIEGASGREQIVRLARPVGFIGYRALFADETHKATAVAIEDSVVCIFDKASLFAVMAENSKLTLGIIRAFATELGFSLRRTVTLTQKHLRGRLAESLICLKDTYGTYDDGQTLRAVFSREDIANLASMTTSNAIRTLSGFAQEGIIALKGKQIKLLSLDRLEFISETG